MDIKNIDLTKFGPLSNFHYKCDNINLFFGNNESGKTALVDAFIQLLFSSRRKIFKNSGRFNNHKGNTIVLSLKGQEYEFPSKEVKLEELLDLPDIELSRLFIVRAGDLNLIKSKRWWPAVRLLLTNMDTDLSRVKDDIYNEVGLTPTGEWSNDRRTGKKREEIEIKEKRLARLRQARDELKQVSYKKDDLKKIEQQLQDIDNKLEELNQAFKYSEYKESQKLLDGYRNIREKLKDFERYKSEYLKQWRDIENELVKLKQKEKVKKDELQNKELEVENIKHSLKDRQAKLDRYNNVLSSIREYKLDSAFLNAVLKKIILKPIIKISILILFLLIGVGLLLSGYYVIAGLEGAILVILYFLQSKIKSNFDKINSKVKQLLNHSENLRVSTLDFDYIKNKVIQLDYNQKIDKESLIRIKKDKNKLKNEVSQLLQPIKKNQDELEELREKTGLATYEDFEEKIEHKRKLILSKDKHQVKLKQKLHHSDEAKWPELVKKMRVSCPKNSIDYSVEEEEELKQDRQKLKKKWEGLNREIEKFSNRVKDGLGLDQTCEIWTEISKLSKELEIFRIDREAALLAAKIMDNFCSNFDSRLKHILQAGNKTVSYYFNRFTDSRYISAEVQDEEFIVKDKKGNSYNFFELSTGAQDQLMLAVRIAFLLEQFKQPGFLILDDAFLTSDYCRRKRLVKDLNELNKSGWQIFYFTIDEHIRDLFVNICGVKAHNLG